jgi:hypothetical protein
VVVLEVEAVVSSVLVCLVLDTVHNVEKAIEFVRVGIVVAVILPAS